jgi:hypothetical protein
LGWRLSNRAALFWTPIAGNLFVIAFGYGFKF